MFSKQVIVVRKDLNMRKGKMIAQGAHASMKVFLDMWSVDVDPTHPLKWFFGFCLKSPCINYVLTASEGSAMQDWLDGTFTKIALSIDSEEEMMNIYHQAKDLMLPCSLVEDVGKTEFHGVKTRTAIAIGPAWSDEIDGLTGHLKLL
jgi:PTH2 family peptidyl-tRNA hydrolase